MVETEYFRGLEEMTITDVVGTDASSYGWGATYKERRINWRWADMDKLKSINILKLLAIKFAIKLVFKEYKNGHIRIMSDNVTAVAYINKMGGCKSPSYSKNTEAALQRCSYRKVF